MHGAGGVPLEFSPFLVLQLIAAFRAITNANPNRRSSREEASIQQSFCLFWDLTIRIVNRKPVIELEAQH
jgi:hypothetical protein